MIVLKSFKLESDYLGLEKNKFDHEVEKDSRMENIQQRRLDCTRLEMDRVRLELEK